MSNNQTECWILTEDGRVKVWEACNLIIGHVEELRSVAQNQGVNIAENWDKISNDVNLAHQALEEVKQLIQQNVTQIPF